MYPGIQFVVIEGRGATRLLAEWLAGADHCRYWPGAKDRKKLPAVRNDVFRWFLEECGSPWLVMLDDDMVVLPETLALFECDGPVAGPRAWAKGGTEAHPHTLGASSLKVHRTAVAAIKPPWFRWPRTGGCECAYFFDKACRAGLRLRKVGAIGHRFPVTVVPGPRGARFLFDSEVRDALTR